MWVKSGIKDGSQSPSLSKSLCEVWKMLVIFKQKHIISTSNNTGVNLDC